MRDRLRPLFAFLRGACLPWAAAFVFFLLSGVPEIGTLALFGEDVEAERVRQEYQRGGSSMHDLHVSDTYLVVLRYELDGEPREIEWNGSEAFYERGGDARIRVLRAAPFVSLVWDDLRAMVLRVVWALVIAAFFFAVGAVLGWMVARDDLRPPTDTPRRPRVRLARVRMARESGEERRSA